MEGDLGVSEGQSWVSGEEATLGSLIEELGERTHAHEQTSPVFPILAETDLSG